MNDNPKYNASGCPDPTAYEALKNVDKEIDSQTPLRLRVYRPMVFVCSPYAGDVKNNVNNARRYSRYAVKQGTIPIAPHLLFPQFMDDTDPEQRELGIFFGLILMHRCSEVGAFGSMASPGMQTEITKARNRGMPVRFFNDECEEVIPYA